MTDGTGKMTETDGVYTVNCLTCGREQSIDCSSDADRTTQALEAARNLVLDWWICVKESGWHCPRHRFEIP
jgi:hypothetical protein